MTSRNNPDDRRLRCAIVGCGKVAAKHLKAIRHLDKILRLTGLVDTRPEAARSLLTQARIREPVPIYQDMAALLEAEMPNLVAITTPSGTHDRLARQALLAGAHVLVEKPLTLSLDQADGLLALAAERHLQIAVGHIYRFFPLVQDLAADLAAGKLGRVLYGSVAVRWGHDQAYYDAASWRGTWEQDGGARMNQSIHALDLMMYLLGGKVVAATGQIGRLAHHMEAEDFGLATLKLDNGTYCLLEGTTATDPNRLEASFTILCSAGEVRAGICAGKPYVRVRDRAGHNLTGRYWRRFLWQTWRKGGLRAITRLGNPHSGIYADLAGAIRNNRPPLADGKSGRDAVAAVLAIYSAAKRGQTARCPQDADPLESMRGFFKEP
jgi:predicted dehydrogenase